MQTLILIDIINEFERIITLEINGFSDEDDRTIITEVNNEQDYDSYYNNLVLIKNSLRNKMMYNVSYEYNYSTGEISKINVNYIGNLATSTELETENYNKKLKAYEGKIEYIGAYDLLEYIVSYANTKQNDSDKVPMVYYFEVDKTKSIKFDGSNYSQYTEQLEEIENKFKMDEKAESNKMYDIDVSYQYDKYGRIYKIIIIYNGVNSEMEKVLNEVIKSF